MRRSSDDESLDSLTPLSESGGSPRRDSPAPTAYFRKDSQSTREEFDRHVRELHEAMEDARVATPPVASPQSRRSPIRHRESISESDLDSNGAATAAIDTVRAIEAARRERRRQLANEEQLTLREQIEENERAASEAVSIRYSHHSPDRPSSASSSSQLHRRFDHDSIDHVTSPYRAPAPTIRSPRTPRTPSSADRSQPSRIIRSPSYAPPPRPSPLLQPPLRSPPRDWTTRSPASAVSTPGKPRPALVRSKPLNWQNLYSAAEARGWSIRPEPRPSQLEPPLKKNIVWTMLTPPPTRVPYETAVRQHAAAAAYSRSRGRSASPPPQPRHQLLPFAFNDDTPLPPRTPPGRRADIEYTPSLSTAISDRTRAESALGEVAPSNSEEDLHECLARALAEERATHERQLAEERQSWQEEKRLIWQHYETDIKTLMQEREESMADATTGDVSRAHEPSPSKSPRPFASAGPPRSSLASRVEFQGDFPSTDASSSERSRSFSPSPFSPSASMSVDVDVRTHRGDLNRSHATVDFVHGGSSSSARVSFRQSASSSSLEASTMPIRSPFRDGTDFSKRLESQLQRLNLLLPNDSARKLRRRDD